MTKSKNLREIVLDTETTGLDHKNGDRIVDIACLELINHMPTGKTFQTYVNPQREMHRDATAISGITDDFLADKLLFHEIADDFLRFVGDSHLVIHNAKFDIGFLNSELNRAGKPTFELEKTVDTLEMARKKFPGSPVSLDALCKRFEIDSSARVTHGALVDCFLLADVYINLLGGRQGGFSFSPEKTTIKASFSNNPSARLERKFAPSREEMSAHDEFLKHIKNPIWENLN